MRRGTLEDLKAQLKSVMDELSTMTPALAGSEWHDDRVEEARWLVGAIESRERDGQS